MSLNANYSSANRSQWGQATGTASAEAQNEEMKAGRLLVIRSGAGRRPDGLHSRWRRGAGRLGPVVAAAVAPRRAHVDRIERARATARSATRGPGRGHRLAGGASPGWRHRSTGGDQPVIPTSSGVGRGAADRGGLRRTPPAVPGAAWCLVGRSRRRGHIGEPDRDAAGLRPGRTTPDRRSASRHGSAGSRCRGQRVRGGGPADRRGGGVAHPDPPARRPDRVRWRGAARTHR